jgi:hypothetical protein
MVALTGVVADLSSLIPSSGDLINQVIVGAGASVVLAGLKTSAGQDAVDPFHIFHHPPAADGSPGGVSTVVGGKSITASALAALPLPTQQQILQQGYVILG